MTRLLLTTEGLTEQNFVLQVLQQHLARFGVIVPKPRCTAISRKHGEVHRGGVLMYRPLRDDIRAWISEDRHPDARFSTMIDLYRLPSDFPGIGEASKSNDHYQRVSILEQAFADDVNSQRFIPYIQLHEFESLLLAEPVKLCEYYPGRERDVAPLQQELARVDNPELIDDGEHSAPSKRIAACIGEYAKAKTTVGLFVAAEIGLPTLRRACRHFNDWIETLESLATTADTAT